MICVIRKFLFIYQKKLFWTIILLNGLLSKTVFLIKATIRLFLFLFDVRLKIISKKFYLNLHRFIKRLIIMLKLIKYYY
jgi:hypothetical protein